MSDEKLLGDIPLERHAFKEVDKAVTECTSDEVKRLSSFGQLALACTKLITLINGEETPCFLLPHVIDFMQRLQTEGFATTFHFAYFELWLNQHSGLSDEQNARIRAKIAGRYIPRGDYQSIFPIGMGKVYPGSHIVTAHSSPDLDTIVAAFWGWVDAFACRVGTGLHRWNVPGGRPNSIIELELLFDQTFGPGIFDFVAKRRSSLSLNSLDLVTQKGCMKKQPSERSYSIDHERSNSAVVLINKEGNYIGDWRSIDVEGVRDVINTFNSLMRWVENSLHIRLISLFAKPHVTAQDFSALTRDHLQTLIVDSEPLENLTMRQQMYLQLFLEKVLQIESGLESTIDHLLRSIEQSEIGDFCSFREAFKALDGDGLFDADGKLEENRPKLFAKLERVVKTLDESFVQLKTSMDSLDIALRIKKDVFNFSPKYLSIRTDIEEIRDKMASYPSLTVNMAGDDGKLHPLGVIYAHELQKSQLATVSLRDFSNREETKVPPYFEVISVVDHHKMNLSTLSAPRTMICDVQSSNVMTAKLAFDINDRYSCGNLKDIEGQIEALKSAQTPEAMRTLSRLIARKMALKSRGEYFIDSQREMLEYLHYLYAIFDDTDLLTKMSDFDCDFVASLVNRLKSMQLGREVEVIAFDDIPRDQNFAKTASSRLLQNRDLFSLYGKVFSAREAAITKHFEKCASGETSAVFVDTKIQNQCARVGQTKMFVANVTTYQAHCNEIRRIWIEKAEKIFNSNHDIDLHLHMISTIASAKELHEGKDVEYWHKDELWIYIPNNDLAEEHLKLFLSSFKACPALEYDSIEVEFLGDNASKLSQIFNESYLKVPQHLPKEGGGLPMAILRFRAGTLNSRKGHVSPYLPKV